MAEEIVSVRLRAHVASYQAAMASAAKSTRAFGAALTDIDNQSAKTQTQVRNMGRGFLIAGGLVAAGLGLSARSAMKWESAFTGVEKTVDGTTAQMSELARGLRDMAKELPASSTEIAGVAEAAGQLGIKVNDIQSFTKTMIDLGEATDLSARDAAISLAQFTNIMGTSGQEIDNLGSTIVDLGNNSATTESQIVEMGTRLAAAGRAVNMSESDVLAFSAALASVGVQAELGGTAMSKFFTVVDDAVKDGGSGLEMLAETAGMTEEAFRGLYGEDSAQAFNAFIQGIGRMAAEGKSVTAVFEELSLTDQRLMRSIKSLAAAGDYLTERLEMGKVAWEENIALQTEAERRYATTESQMAMTGNKINDLAIDIGSTLLPAVNSSIDVIGNMADGLASMPGPAKAATTTVAALGSAASVTLGGLVLLVPKIKEAQTALSGMGGAGQMLGRNLGKVTAGLAGAAVAVSAGILVYERATRSSREYADAVRDLAAELGAVLDGEIDLGETLTADIKEEFDNLDTEVLEAANRFGYTIDNVLERVAVGGDSLDVLRDKARELGIEFENGPLGKESFTLDSEPFMELAHAIGVDTWALRELIDVTEDVDDVAQDAAQKILLEAVSLDQLEQSAIDASVSQNQLMSGGTNWVAVLEDMVGATMGASTSTDVVAIAMENAEESAEALKEATDAVSDAFDRLFGIDMSAEKALLNSRDAFDEMSATLEENGATLDVNTEKGRENRKAILDAADAAQDHVQALIDQGASAEEVKGALSTYSAGLAETMRQAGFSEDAIAGYIATLGLTPDNIATIVELQGVADAESQLDALARVRTAYLRVQLETRGYVATPGGGKAQRWGGVHAYANGGITPAHITANEIIKYGEPETGGEAFIPRKGARSRSLSILRTAASWYGAKVTEMADGGVVGSWLDAGHGDIATRNASRSRLFNTPYGQAALEGSEGDVGAALESLNSLADVYTELVEVIGEYGAETLLAAGYTEDDFTRAARAAIDANMEYRKELEAAAEAYAEAAEDQRRIEDAMFQLGSSSQEQYISVLKKRQAAEEQWSQEWVRITLQIRELQREAHEEEMRRTEEAMDRRQDALDHLNRLLDEEQSIRARITNLQSRHAAQVAQAHANLARAQADAYRQRREELEGWIGVEERYVDTWANRAVDISRNIRDQINVFAEWERSLDDLRGRGVSEAVIDLLQLDEGPQSLHKIKMLAKASDAELAELNAAAADRASQVGNRVVEEATQAGSDLAEALREIRENHADEMRELMEEFLEEQRELNKELAEIGEDGGRSFGEALAEGLMSQVPAVRAAAAALAAAAGAAGGGGGGGGGTLVNTTTGRAAFTGPNGEAGLARYDPNTVLGANLQSWTMPDGRTAWYAPGQYIDPGNKGALAAYDVGTPYVPGDGVAMLHKGERVLSALDNARLVAAVEQASMSVGAGSSGGHGAVTADLSDAQIQAMADQFARSLAKEMRMNRRSMN